MNSGEVPLHGRLFAQWLHLAFPHVSEEGSELRAHHWLGGKAIASVDERINHVESVLNVKSQEHEEVVLPAALALGWSDEEILPLLDGHQKQSALGHLVRSVVQVAMFLVVLRTVFKGLSSVRNLNADAKDAKGKAKGAMDFLSDGQQLEV